MPIINSAIIFSEDSAAKIAAAKATPGFDHNYWSSEELESVRSEIRDFYRTEQRLKCAFCMNPISSRSALGASIEHIAAKSAYLQFIFEPMNLCVICPDCNEFKRAREVFVEPATKTKNKVKYPSNPDDFIILHPHIDEYETHIIKTGHLYTERTMKGGYTIFVCCLNRFYHQFGVSEEYVNDVQALAEADAFHKQA